MSHRSGLDLCLIDVDRHGIGRVHDLSPDPLRGCGALRSIEHTIHVCIRPLGHSEYLGLRARPGRWVDMFGHSFAPLRDLADAESGIGRIIDLE